MPSNAEWTQLTTYLGGEDNAGSMLAGDYDKWWNNYNAYPQNADSKYFGASGFNALPTGVYYINYYVFGDEASWWSATQYNESNIYTRYIYARYSYIRTVDNDMVNGYGVRCVKNGENTASGPSDPTGTYNNHGYVDLGLPSGTMWATCNVGANSPEDIGNYYAWGETEPKETYDWSTYRYCNGSQSTLTKYCSSENLGNDGFTDGLTALEASDDAATVNWGEDWRMPTTLDIDELILKCTFETIEQNGVLGSLVTGPNGNSIFLPASGYYNGNSVVLEDRGYYWSSTNSISASSSGYDYLFYNGEYKSNSLARQYGFPVRPIYRAIPTTSVSGTQSYYCDFEDETENFKWMIDTSSSTMENKWYIGAAANNGGNSGLYVSNDNGASNEYGSSRTYIYAYRSFGITENDFYEASFDWRAMGAGNTHLLRAFIIPMSQNPYLKKSSLDEGNVMPGNNNDAPDGWIDGELGILNRQSEWQHASIQAQLEAGAYYLVFFWKNSSSSLLYQPPAAIDNISIHKSACPFVGDITVSVTDQSAEISWTEQGSAENWEIVVSETPLDNDALNSSENIVPLTTASYSATGLSSLTQYYVYVRAACSTDDKSRWESTTFMTGGVPIVTTLYPDTRTNTTAMLRAKAISADDVNYTFYYGTSRNSLSAISNAAPTVTDSIATIQLSNLNPEVYYYYTAEATNSYGTVRGDTLAFLTYGQITDERDGKQYYTIQIGEQKWLAENLRYEGDIPLMILDNMDPSTQSTEIAYRYYPGYPNASEDNVSIYGYLYNWPAAMNGASSSGENPSGVQGICPNGWHLPSLAEWEQLRDALGGQASDKAARLSGRYDLWQVNIITNSPYLGESGFNALPAGGGIGQSSIGIYTHFTSSTEYDESSAVCGINIDNNSAYYGTLGLNGCNGTKASEKSVRCILPMNRQR